METVVKVTLVEVSGYRNHCLSVVLNSVGDVQSPWWQMHLARLVHGPGDLHELDWRHGLVGSIFTDDDPKGIS